MPICAASELSLSEVIAILAASERPSSAVTDSPVDVSEVFVETFLRSLSADRPVRCSAQIVGRVECRAGEGPSFEIGVRAVTIDMSWSDALFNWSDVDGQDSAAMPLHSLSRYIVQGCVVLGPWAVAAA
jgi:hypothetical protein